MFEPDLVNTLLKFFVLTVSLTFHEAAHALAAFRLGDPTAEREGRLSLNPMVHFDIMGTLMILFAPIGWAKPVPVDPRNLKNPRRDMSIIALAGPGSNVVLGIIGCVIFAIVNRFGMDQGWYTLLATFITVNFALAVFNLLPVFPLDGSKSLSLFMNDKQASRWDDFSMRFGLYPLIAIIAWSAFIGGGPLMWWFDVWRPILNPLGSLFGVYKVL